MMPKYINVDKLRFPNVAVYDMMLDGEAIPVIRLDELHKFPSEDVVEVRHGRWHDVYMSSASSFVGTCSVCGKSNDIPPVPLAKYCPSCGAKMEGIEYDV